jgi:hypothetical protein
MKYLTVVCVSLTRIPTEYLVVTSAAIVNTPVGPSAETKAQVLDSLFQPSDVAPAPLRELVGASVTAENLLHYPERGKTAFTPMVEELAPVVS